MELISKGNTAEIFAYNDGLICKLFYSGYPEMYVEHEYNNAKTVSQLGLLTPTAYKRITVDGRNGIIYDRVIGEPLSLRMCNANEEEKTKWDIKFADLHKGLLSHHIDSVLNYKDFLKMFAGGKAEIITQINDLADGDSLLHGDFHPGNVMVDANNQLYIIDMMNICKGPAIYDIARTYYLLGNDTELQKRYLKLMECDLQHIMPYVEVILRIRENEMNNGISR